MKYYGWKTIWSLLLYHLCMYSMYLMYYLQAWQAFLLLLFISQLLLTGQEYSMLPAAWSRLTLMAKYKIYPDNSFPSGVPAASVSSLTLYRPLEERLARLARGHPVVVAARHVAAHEARPPAGLLLLLDGVLQLWGEELLHSAGTHIVEGGGHGGGGALQGVGRGGRAAAQCGLALQCNVPTLKLRRCKKTSKVY